MTTHGGGRGARRALRVPTGSGQRKRRDWTIEAKCFGISDQGVVFEDIGLSGARDYCADCPVFNECLSHALVHEEFGYWAGTSAGARRKLRKENKGAMEKLVLSAISSGWIEDYTAVPSVVEEVSELAATKAKKFRKRNSQPVVVNTDWDDSMDGDFVL